MSETSKKMEDLQGGDITAEHMVVPPNQPSKVQHFYTASTVFITGATGFLGKLVMEKLVRTCPDLKQIYILVRPKKGKDTKQRFQEIFEAPMFERVRREQPQFNQKIDYLSGDCALPDLGLDEKDKEKLMTEVDCIFHCAATVRFDEHIRTATYINIRATRDIIRMAKQMKQLRAMVHISTAYSHCLRKQIDECFYETKLSGDNLLAVVQALDDEILTDITPKLIGEWPNTYVFTKAIAEEVVKTEGQGLPITVVRPSVVISTAKEPVAGWIDNMYGCTGILIGAALGLIRSLHADGNKMADMVPADYVVNTAIAAAWDIAAMKTLNDNKEKISYEEAKQEEKYEKSIPVYNSVSSPENPITWGEYMKLGEKHAPKIPTHLMIWHYCFALRANYYWHMFCVLFLHYLPAYIVDFIAICIGRKPLLIKAYKKIGKFTNVLAYFSTKQWQFRNANVQSLWGKMEPGDRKLFEFSMKGMDWDSYFHTYVRGARVYLLKDPMDTLPEGRIKYRKVQIAHYTLVTCLLFLAYKILEWTIRYVFNI